MKKLLELVVPLSLLLWSCSTDCSKCNNGSIEKWKDEIVKTELEFTELAQKEGIPKAFLTYAAEDAVLRRGNLIIGKEAIKKFLEKNDAGPENGILAWKPDFVDVSSSGDLGYTYGKYTYSVTDSAGNTKVDSGIFHTVWKRQPDGKWRFVWD